MMVTDEHNLGLQPGTVIAGKYEVIKCLGSGSMGSVYACRHRELAGHVVAVKVLFAEVGQDEVAAARFRNEIFASYGVSHPNVVRAYEYIRDGELIAYTMEHVEGGDLAGRLQNPELMTIPEIISILSQMCAGVQAIHDAGIVHRDLKPENILLTREGVVKIADFGIARTGQGPKLTEHGGVVGTIDYVSPEYMMKSQVDWRSDIYAMGILAYEMIAGESPFKADSVYATMTLRIKTDAQPPSTVRPECPAALDQIVLKAMARDPEERYQSAAQMLFDLQNSLPELSKPVQQKQIVSRVQKPAEAYRGPTVDLTARAVEQTLGAAGLSAERDVPKLEPEGRVFNRSQSGAWQSRKTEAVGTEIIDLSRHYEEEAQYVPKMESVLQNRNSLVFDMMNAEAKNNVFSDSPSLTGVRGQALLQNYSKSKKKSKRVSLFAKLIIFGVLAGVAAGIVYLKFFVVS
jgi:serine/threonine protein kinase